MAVEFEISDRKVDDDTHVVAVVGEIDLFTAPEFKQRMSELIDAGRSRLVVDLSGTTFIDSSSLGVLIGAHRRLKLRGSGKRPRHMVRNSATSVRSPNSRSRGTRNGSGSR